MDPLVLEALEVSEVSMEPPVLEALEVSTALLA
jgi:hypothetical protein